jgi:PAS domain S-box-containing protein
MALVVVVQFQWILGLQDLSSFGKRFNPMAEETALLFLISNLLLAMFIFNPQNRNLRSLHYGLTSFIGIVAIMTILDIFTNYQWGISDFLGAKELPRNGYITGRMSILTGICFLFVYMSFILLRTEAKKYSVFFSISILLFSYIFFIGYAYGVPLVFNKYQIPMAWPTAVAFIILAVGLLFAAGKENAPISYFVGHSTRALLLRNLLPPIFILQQVNNIIGINISKDKSFSSTLTHSIVDLFLLLFVGMIISLVSKYIGDSIDQYIAERKVVEIKLLQISQAVEQSPISILITDLAGNIVYVNPKFENISGYSSAEVMGKNPRILKSGYTSGKEYKSLWDTITAGKEWQGEFHNKKKNGELYWESVTIAPIKNEEGETVRYLALKEDINDRKKVEEQLRKIAWKQNHEIRAPLTTIMGIVSAMKLKISLEEKIILLDKLNEPVIKLDQVIHTIVNETLITTKENNLKNIKGEREGPTNFLK